MPLPLCPAPPAFSPLGDRDTTSDRPAATEPRQLTTSILSIDDEIQSDDALVGLLALQGFQVDCTQSGAAGLALASSRLYDAVILDLKLPDMYGLAALASLVASNVSVPVLVVTGFYLEPEVETIAMRAGAAAFRRKPFVDVDELASVLRRIIIESAPSQVAVSRSDSCERSVLMDGADYDVRVAPLLEVLRRMLRSRFPRVSNDLLNDAAEDSILDYLRSPSHFDATRGTALASFLFPGAVRDVKNLLKAETRRKTRESTYASEQIAQPVGDICLLIERAEMSEEVRRRVLSVVVDDAERRAALRWLLGCRTTGTLAAALGLSHLTPSDQKREVKRFKERILRRLFRLG